MGHGTRITADVGHGAWIVRVAGPLDAAGVTQLAFTLGRLLRTGTADLVVDLRGATGEADELLAQTQARAKAAGLGFALVEPEDADEDAALARAALSSRRRRGPTALTPEQVLAAA
jgi:hypothetical protein